jgi:hypothetical protein
MMDYKKYSNLPGTWDNKQPDWIVANEKDFHDICRKDNTIVKVWRVGMPFFMESYHSKKCYTYKILSKGTEGLQPWLKDNKLFILKELRTPIKVLTDLPL